MRAKMCMTRKCLSVQQPAIMNLHNFAFMLLVETQKDLATIFNCCSFNFKNMLKMTRD